MQPVDQTIFYDPTQPPERQRGNCLQAVLASMLHLPLAEVPHFVQDHVDHDGDSNPEWDWWHRQVLWLRDRGYRLDRSNPEPGEYVMATGPSPRGQGIFHIVILRDGVLAHDPHPDRTGILSVLHVDRLVPA